MSDTRADEAAKTYTPGVVEVSECEGWLQEQAERIAELERREALLMAGIGTGWMQRWVKS